LSQPEIVINDLPANEFEHIAALDLGSNSFHLVVTRIVNGSVQIVHRVKQRVELAQGLRLKKSVLLPHIPYVKLVTLMILFNVPVQFCPTRLKLFQAWKKHA
jgi:hypothetical protein